MNQIQPPYYKKSNVSNGNYFILFQYCQKQMYEIKWSNKWPHYPCSYTFYPTGVTVAKSLASHGYLQTNLQVYFVLTSQQSLAIRVFKYISLT